MTLVGRLHPADFPVRQLDLNEMAVVDSLIDLTDNHWVVMPTLRIAEQPPAEIDIVVAHPVFGVGIVEVKGYTPEIRGGRWHGPYDNDGSGPPGQLNRNMRAVEALVRSCHPTLRTVAVWGAVAFPRAKGFASDERPTDLRERQILWSSDVDDIGVSLARVMPKRSADNPMIPDGLFDTVIQALRPDVEFSSDPAAYAAWAQKLIERINGNHVRALERLDANRKVYVTGGAGTGKSRLAMAWATRSQTQREERALLVCFNEPLGYEFQRRLAHFDNLVAGPYVPVALGLEGMPVLHMSDERRADQDFWNNDVNGHLHLNWPSITDRFDTIIIDEAQDFSPAWLAQLEALLDPDGPRRFLLVGDSDQELHQRGFTPPRSEDGWAVCELVSNTRNSVGIARLLRSRLKGPPAPQGAPESTHLRYRALAQPLDGAQLVAEVVAEVDRLHEAGYHDDSIAVVCLDSTARNTLRQSPQFCRWEDRAEGRVVCENAHRVKGLEFSAVVMVGSKWPIDDTVLYVAVSRAVLGLTVIGPRGLGERLALEATSS
jgi:hypothetical protein